MEDISRHEEGNRRKGLIFSVVLHTLLIILAAIYGFTYQDPPPEQEGILVNLGIPDVGQGVENAPGPATTKPADEPKPTPVEPTPPPKPTSLQNPKPQPQREVRQTEDPEAIALRKRQEEAKRQTEAEDRQRRIEEQQRRDAEARAEAERKRQEAEQQALKDRLAGGGISGSGSGKGNTGKPGNQGVPNGDPNSNILTGISTGSGVVGGGLGSRGLVRRGPSINDNSQEEGRIVLQVCVDADGNVISADYTQSGSTSTSENLKRLAIQNARQWKFNRGSVDKQCGTISYEFRLK